MILFLCRKEVIYMLKGLTYIPGMQIKNIHKYYFNSNIILEGLEILKFSCVMLLVGLLMVIGLFIVVGVPWLMMLLFI